MLPLPPNPLICTLLPQFPYLVFQLLVPDIVILSLIIVICRNWRLLRVLRVRALGMRLAKAVWTRLLYRLAFLGLKVIDSIGKSIIFALIHIIFGLVLHLQVIQVTFVLNVLGRAHGLQLILLFFC